MNLAEYRNRTASLADYLPWAALVATGRRPQQGRIVPAHGALPWPGSRQRDAGRTHRHHGAPQQRAPASWAPVGRFSSRRSAARRPLIRTASFLRPRPRWSISNAASSSKPLASTSRAATTSRSSGCRPPRMPRAPRAGSTRGAIRPALMPHELLRGFIDRTDRVLQLFEGFVPEVDWLDDPETLTYLHSTVSTKRQRVRVPETPMHLDALLTDQPLVGGLEPRLGNAHLRTLTVIGFPTTTHPGILDELNRLAFPYRWSTRAILLDKTRGRPTADQDPAPMVRQAQGHRRDPQGSDDQRGVGPRGQ